MSRWKLAVSVSSNSLQGTSRRRHTSSTTGPASRGQDSGHKGDEMVEVEVEKMEMMEVEMEMEREEMEEMEMEMMKMEMMEMMEKEMMEKSPHTHTMQPGKSVP